MTPTKIRIIKNFISNCRWVFLQHPFKISVTIGHHRWLCIGIDSAAPWTACPCGGRSGDGCGCHSAQCVIATRFLAVWIHAEHNAESLGRAIRDKAMDALESTQIHWSIADHAEPEKYNNFVNIFWLTVVIRCRQISRKYQQKCMQYRQSQWAPQARQICWQSDEKNYMKLFVNLFLLLYLYTSEHNQSNKDQQ